MNALTNIAQFESPLRHTQTVSQNIGSHSQLRNLARPDAHPSRQVAATPGDGGEATEARRGGTGSERVAPPFCSR